MNESPIFSKTYDLLCWLIPATTKFPRQHRFVLAQTLQSNSLKLHEQLLEASYSKRPKTSLHQADITLAKLRLQLRLCHDLDLLSHGQYKHVAAMVDEIGRLLGGWKKTQNSESSA